MSGQEQGPCPPGDRTTTPSSISGGEPADLAVLFWPRTVDLDNFAALRHAVDSALDGDGIVALIFDLRDVRFLDSLGLGLMIHARNQAMPRAITVSLRNVPESTDRLLDVAGLAHLFPRTP